MTDLTVNKEKDTSTKKPTSNTIPIRIKKATARTLKSIINKLNKKQFGRKVIADDVIDKALSTLNGEDLEEIKISTYSSADQLELQYRNYCRKNGYIDKEEFIKLLLKAGLPAINNLNKNNPIITSNNDHTDLTYKASSEASKDKIHS